jgi:hypothetical protein
MNIRKRPVYPDFPNFRLFAEFQATFGPGDFFVVSQLTRLYGREGAEKSPDICARTR